MSKYNITLSDLKKALENSEFKYHYQPQISLIDGTLIGAEALIRWYTPEGIIIPPNEFIPIAEETGFITEITYVMFDAFIKDLKTIHEFNSSIIVSINFSALDLKNEKLLDKITNYVNTGEVTTTSFSIEITEASLCTNYNWSFFEKFNVILIMDDFGTGYSNLTALINTPFKKIKLDYSLIKNLGVYGKDTEIIIETIRLAHRLDLQVIAEGVETKAIYQILQDNGCHAIQGYLISKPIELSKFIQKFIQEENIWPHSILGNIRMAQLDHICWRNSLIVDTFHKMNKVKHIEMDNDVIDNCCSCHFGRWYDSCTVPSLLNNPYFIAIDDPHKKLHEIGCGLRKMDINKDATLESILKMINKLSEQSSVVLNAINDLELNILSQSLENKK